MKEISIERIKNGSVWMKEKVELDVADDTSINEKMIVQEMVRQPRLAATYGELAGELRAELARKEDNLKKVFASKSVILRSQHEQNKQKITEKTLECLVLDSLEYQDALNDLQETRLNSLKIDSWYRAIAAKRDLLTAITYRQNTEMKSY